MVMCTFAFAQKGKVYPSSNPLPRFSEGVLQNYIRKHVVYPEQAKQQKLEGRVVVSFIIEVDGKVSNVTVLKSTNTVFNDAALACIKSLPVFKPGFIDGKPVRVQMYEAVPFSLKPIPDVEDEPVAEQLVEEPAPNIEVVEADPSGIDAAMVEAPPVEAPASSADEVFTFVEHMPEFPGDLNSYLSKNLNYPAEAKEKNIQGKVIVQYIVGADGFIYDVKVLRPLHPALDKEAMRVIKAMPKWKPGKQNGRAVAVRYTLPINFVLN